MAQKIDVNASLVDPTRQPLLVSYDKYLDAQLAVDKLSDEKFPVAGVSIVGVDLKMVEVVLGRMSWGRAAAGGLLTGAWFGLLLGIFVSFFAKTEDMSGTTLILLGLVYGAGFGIIFGLVSYWMTGGKRDFVSRSQILASRYDVHVDARTIGDARKILGITAQWPPPVDAPGAAVSEDQ
ncbi:MAG: general stress protein [Actinomycetes bacterium]